MVPTEEVEARLGYKFQFQPAPQTSLLPCAIRRRIACAVICA
jgi:hypothetical protein